MVECPKCIVGPLRRRKRTNFFTRVVLPWFGRYPWICENCKTTFLIRDRGPKWMRGTRPSRTSSGRLPEGKPVRYKPTPVNG